MATLSKSGFGSLPIFWNVDASVGRGCPNKRYDVYLVQFFLTKIHASQKLPAAYLPKGAVRVNGTWHDTMYEAIWLFQDYLHKSDEPNPLPQILNGQVDRALHGPNTRWGTIIYLNLFLKKARPDLYDNLLTSKEVPDSLQWHLFDAVAQSQPKKVQKSHKIAAGGRR